MGGGGGGGGGGGIDIHSPNILHEYDLIMLKNQTPQGCGTVSAPNAVKIYKSPPIPRGGGGGGGGGGSGPCV